MTQPPILLIEDNDDDADLTMMAFRDASISNPILRVRDGGEALSMLQSAIATNSLPVVILLDLNLPRVNGLEVLEKIRELPATRYLPIVVLTSSDEDSDRVAAYARQANSYVRKPVDYDEFVAASRRLGLYWTVTNVPPPAADS